MTTKTFQFANGDEVVETIFGFRGIIIGTRYYLTGCNQYLVGAKAKDELSQGESVWYDEGRLRLVKSKPSKCACADTESDSGKSLYQFLPY